VVASEETTHKPEDPSGRTNFMSVSVSSLEGALTLIA
jgi:hypothetical protein